MSTVVSRFVVATYLRPLVSSDCVTVHLSSPRLFLLVRVAATVLVTFALCWLPFLSDPTQALQVVRRIFPVARGLYEVLQHSSSI